MDKTEYMAAIEAINDQAINILREDKEFSAHCFLLLNTVEGEPAGILLAPFSPELGGEDVRKLVAAHRPQAVITALEGLTGPDEGEGRPEALIVASEHVEHGDFYVVNVIKRQGKKVSVINNFNQYREVAEHNKLGIGGRFSGLLGSTPTNQTTPNIKRKPGYRKHFKKTGLTIH